MRDELIAIIAEFLDVDPKSLENHKTLDDLKMDSLDFIEIMFEIDEKYNIPVLSDIQSYRDQIHDLGDMLRITEMLIVKHRDSAAVGSHDSL